MARMEEGRGVHKVLVGRPERARPLGRHGCRLKDIIKLDAQELGLRGTGLIWFRTGTGGMSLCMYQ